MSYHLFIPETDNEAQIVSDANREMDAILAALKADRLASGNPGFSVEAYDEFLTQWKSWVERYRGMGASDTAARESIERVVNLILGYDTIVNTPVMIKSTRFVVEGRFEFPIDMLRYDYCYPASEMDSAKITASIVDDEPAVDPIRVTLLTRGVGPTPRRWESFGWTVVENKVLG